ncbi:MAG: hypothetical protein FWF44_10770 [Defluviitaleaceae bacterium]|nr:hypothetical protein [Defluviitaleaceae bacterium]
MELPFFAIRINTGEENFELQLTNIDEYTAETLKWGGVSAKFKIIVDVKGIHADFQCCLTVGNLYNFYMQLSERHKNLQGSAELKYYSESLTNIIFTFDKSGHCVICGMVQNGTYSGNKVGFKIECDQTFITPVLVSLRTIFTEFAEIQGNYIFY